MTPATNDPNGTPSSEKNRPPVWLQSAGIVATIILAAMALIGVLVAAVHFTIQADVGPRLTEIEISINKNSTEIAALKEVTKAQYLSLKKRLDDMDQQLARIEGVLQKR